MTKYELPHVVTLKHPFQVGSKTIEKVTFQNPLQSHMVAHLKAGENATIGELFPLVEGMTGELPKVIEDMDWKDGQTCCAIANYFLSGGRETTED